MLGGNRTASEEVDVLIIGAGMAGGALAKRLSDHGVSVVCLEQGREIHPMELPHMSESWELEKTRDHSPQPNVRAWPEDYPVMGEAKSTIRMVNGVGGSALRYSAHWPRLKPVDFRKGTEHGLAPDWPISYEDLEPFFEINDNEMGIAGLPGDPAQPPKNSKVLPHIPLGEFGRTIAGGFERLGWHWWPLDNAIVTQQFDDRLPCNHCGQCVLGCPRGSVSTSMTSYWPRAVRNGASLRTWCRVERIVVKDGRATGAVYVDLLTGERQQQNARVVIVASNGIGTPRLLLMSNEGANQEGIANSSGLVGKNLMFHPQAFVEGIFDEPMDSFKGARGAPLYSQEFYDTDVGRGFVNGFSLLLVRAPGAGYAATGYATFPPIAWGERHHDEFKRMFNHHAWFIVMGEDLPLERNTVTLDPVLKDGSGLPAPKISYRMHDQDRDLVKFGIARGEDVMRAAGASLVSNSGVLEQPPGYHLLGTARMGNDPRSSVTNKFHRSWDIPNLFICDGSSMPTSAGVNPTSTIGAMAVRLADHLVRNRATAAGIKRTTADC